ncbi:GntR family transcriptional regulator [Nonomuraea sp. NPDC026600]|uniref:GntR family transcriptional regulator n=1 Tax=Nonomuraea sp. NPDC026600 TaxID=3155363 RepID=UPI0033CE093B
MALTDTADVARAATLDVAHEQHRHARWVGTMTTAQQPPYARIAAALRADIDAGVYGPQDALPSQQQIVQLYQVSPVTAREALKELVRVGAAYAEQGRGYYVRRYRRTPADVESLVETQELNEVDVDTLSAPPLVSDLMPDADTVLVRRVSAGATTYYEPSLADVIPEARAVAPLTHPTDLQLLHERGVTLRRSRTLIIGRMSTQDESDRLDLLPVTPVLEAATAFADAEGRIRLIRVSVMPADLYTVKIDWT